MRLSRNRQLRSGWMCAARTRFERAASCEGCEWDVFDAMEGADAGKGQKKAKLSSEHLKQLAILKGVWQKDLGAHRMRMLKVLSSADFGAERDAGPDGWPAHAGGAADDEATDDDDEDEDAELVD